jgi:hypothetical protein
MIRPETEIKRSAAISSKTLLRALIDDLGHDPELINGSELQALGERLSMIARLPQGKIWGRSYMHAVLHGTLNASPALVEAIQALGAITDGMRQEMALARHVSVLAMGEIRPGSLVLANSQKCIGCGMDFVPRVPWQKRHARNCGK